MRVAAIVNENARRLGDRDRARLAAALPGAVAFTRTLDHARREIRAAIGRGVDAIALGGGDGTVVMGLTLIEEACRGTGRPEPAIAVLRLGAANAIADAVGATADPAGELARIARGGGRWRALPVIRALGVRTPIVTVGLEAELRGDREALDRIVDRVPVARRLVGDPVRAALALALRSAPRAAIARAPEAVISDLGAGARSPLWRGPCSVVAAATIPYFGVGGRVFARGADRPDRFRLRCGAVGWSDLLRLAPGLRRVANEPAALDDFLCDHVQIELEAEATVTAAGEPLGRVRRLVLALAAPVTVIAPAGDP